MTSDNIEQVTSLVKAQTARLEQISGPWSHAQCITELKALPHIFPEIGAEKPQTVLQDATNLETIMIKGMGDGMATSYNLEDHMDRILESVSDSVSLTLDLTKDDWDEIGTDLKTISLMPENNTFNDDGLLNDGSILVSDKVIKFIHEVDMRRTPIFDIAIIGKKYKIDLYAAANAMAHWSKKKLAAELRDVKIKAELENESFEEQQVASSNKADITPDEREQIRLLEAILAIWKSYEGQEPLYFWEIVISDSYSETVENMFYMTFLSKLNLIYIWESENYNSVVFVPNYGIIERSKFGRSDKITGHRNKKRVRYQCDPKLRKETDDHLDMAEKDTDRIRSKYSKAKHAMRSGPAGHAELSRNGSFNITLEEWEKWVNYLKKRSVNNGETWEKLIQSRSTS